MNNVTAYTDRQEKILVQFIYSVRGNLSPTFFNSVGGVRMGSQARENQGGRKTHYTNRRMMRDGQGGCSANAVHTLAY
jgi:hypothetical protein